MVQDADHSDDLLHELHTILQSALPHVGWIANQSVAFRNAVWAFDSNNSPVLEEYLIDVSVQHESASVDSADSRKPFRDASQPEDGVDEGTWVFAHRVHVKLNFPDEIDGRSIQEAVISVEGDCVADEVNGVLFELVLG